MMNKSKPQDHHKENSNGISSSNGLNNSSSNHTSTSNRNESTTANNNQLRPELTIEDRKRNELFLQTFEKPTQIYRFLRIRHHFSPLFLHRNLSYMKQRRTKNYTKGSSCKFSDGSLHRKLGFKVSDDQSCIEPLSETTCKINHDFENLIIKFDSVNIKNMTIDHKSIVNVIVSLLKINTKNSLESLDNNQIVIGECKLNGKDNLNKITILKENFTSNYKHVLRFEVIVNNKKSLSSSNHHHSSLNGINGHNSAPGIANGFYKDYVHTNKKIKTNCDVTSNNTIFTSELVILADNQKSLLDGDFTLILNKKNSQNDTADGDLKPQENVQDSLNKIQLQSASSPFNHSSDDLAKDNCVKFYLKWSSSDRDTIVQSIKSQHSIKNSHQAQILKQIEPPNTEINNNMSKTSFSKNSRKYNACLHSNGNGNSNGNTTATTITANCNSLTNGNSQSNDQLLRLLSHHVHQPNNHCRNSNITNSSSTNSKVIYCFWFNEVLLQQTTPYSDFRCPWCGIDCLQILSLKHHLISNHDRFNFTMMFDSKVYKVNVMINKLFDGSYDGDPQQDMSNFGNRIRGPLQRTSTRLFSINLRGHSRKIINELMDNESIDVDFLKPNPTGHNRLYYHSGTCQPIKPYEFEQDSEDDIDPEWMQIKTQLMIDEFTDVNEGEKEVMKLWNLHMMKYHYIGGVHVPLACERFVQENWREIINRNIYMNFVLHLNNLFDYGLLSSSELRAIVKYFHETKNEGISD